MYNSVGVMAISRDPGDRGINNKLGCSILHMLAVICTKARKGITTNDSFAS